MKHDWVKDEKYESMVTQQVVCSRCGATADPSCRYDRAGILSDGKCPGNKSRKK